MLKKFQMRKGLRVGDFVLNERLGRGGFGEVWASTSLSDHMPVAVKVAPLVADQRNILEVEAQIMSQIRDSPCFPRFIKYWTEGSTAFLAMELLESTVQQTTEAAFGSQLSLKEGASLGIQMLAAVASLHRHGFVHRDIKPSNFMYRTGTSPPAVCLIDFGLAKMWRNQEGNVVPARYGVGFRGTARYASINSHDGADLSCRDDLWSLFYILVEMVAPPLPWYNQESRDVVAQIKRRTGMRLVAGLPPQFADIANYIGSLSFSDTPDYEMILGKLKEIEQLGEEEEARNMGADEFGLDRPMFDHSVGGDSSMMCSERVMTPKQRKKDREYALQSEAKFRCRCVLL